MKRSINLLIIVLSLLSCEPLAHKHAESSILFLNNSDKALFFFESYVYPDTVLPGNRPDLYYVTSKKSRYISLDETIEKVFEDLPEDTLSIYIFDEDTVDAYEWSQIKQGYKVLKRYDLSLQDLESMNGTVTYP